MGSKLVGTIHRDQGTDRDETAVAFRKSGPFPDVPEQNIIGELGQLGGEIAHQLLGAGWRLIDADVGRCRRGMWTYLRWTG